MATILTSIDPTTQKTIGSYQAFTRDEVQNAIERAQQTFRYWKHTQFHDRAKVLIDIATKLRDNKDMLARLAASEMGKPVGQGMAEVEKCAVTLEYYAMHGAAFLADETIEMGVSKSYVTFRPLGVVLAIMPWNFPYWQVFRAFAPTIMAGNVMLLKHASNVSGCALAIQQVLKDAGHADLMQTLLIPGADILPLIDHEAIAAVTLTGSTEAGKQVAAVAGRNLKKAVLELGGSDAYVVLADADVDAAATICVAGRTLNSGQSCIAAKRFIVAREVIKAFEVAMVQKMNALKFGDPKDHKTGIGPLARLDLRDELHRQVLKSVEMGAQVLCGGFIPEGVGAYYPPTVLTKVTNDMPAYDEELFGPVAAIITVDSERHAMELANDSIYGLGGCILSADSTKAEHLAVTAMDAGSCFVNDFVRSDARLPFGGIKQSGYGRELGKFGIREFVNIKSVYVK